MIQPMYGCRGVRYQLPNAQLKYRGTDWRPHSVRKRPVYNEVWDVLGNFLLDFTIDRFCPIELLSWQCTEVWLISTHPNCCTLKSAEEAIDMSRSKWPFLGAVRNRDIDIVAVWMSNHPKGIAHCRELIIDWYILMPAWSNLSVVSISG
jgi:hypothetical protein